MPTPKTPQNSLQSTRQMLDELDALMERMLSLPVTGHEEPSPPVAIAPTPTVAASLTMIEDLVEPRPIPTPKAPPPEPKPRVNYETPPPEQPPARVATAPVAPIIVRPPKTVRVSEGPRWVVPLLWTNDAYDAGTRFFGPLGVVFRSGFVRMALGITGIGLLVWALAWLVRDLIGWTP